MVRYPITLEEDDNDTWLVSFPDFPEAHTFGDDPDEAIAHAHDALATVIDGYIRSRRPIPSPSPIKKAAAELSALMSAKVELYRAMYATNTTKSALARKLDVHLPQIDRLLNLRHGSKVEQIEAACEALGGRLEVNFVGIPLVPATGLKRVIDQAERRGGIRTRPIRVRSSRRDGRSTSPARASARK
jgi:antitoxin HicB